MPQARGNAGYTQMNPLLQSARGLTYLITMGRSPSEFKDKWVLRGATLAQRGFFSTASTATVSRFSAGATGHVA